MASLCGLSELPWTNTPFFTFVVSKAASTLATSTKASATGTSGSSTGAAAAHYAQCGGTGWAGATTCAAGYTCTAENDYYSQCL